MDSSQIFARHAAQTTFVDLPVEAIEATRRNLLDTIGVAIAGATAPGCREVSQLVIDNYSSQQATVWSSGGRKATATEAALANGTMGHALDFDDTHDAAILHAGVSVVPAALAVAEQVGGVSGKELITAVTLGLDLVCRLGVASKEAPIVNGWLYTSLYGLFGSALAAGKLMGLDEERLGHALGIAYSQASGNIQPIHDGALSKRMQPGFAARVGVLSAMLAQAGITGTKRTFEGSHGLAKTYLGNHYDRELVLKDLGNHYEHINLGYKPYPSCRHSHNSIDVALKLREQHGIDPNQIESIRVGVNEEGYINLCTPADVRAAPRVVVEAQFSIPFLIATALVKGEVFIDDLTGPELKNPEVLGLSRMVQTYVDADIQRTCGRAISPADLTITMKNGQSYSLRSDLPLGSVQNPLGFDALAEKFRRCLRYSGRFSEDKDIEFGIGMFRNLESMKDVRRLVSALV